MTGEVPLEFADVIGFGAAKNVFLVKKSTKWINVTLATFFILAALVGGGFLAAQVVSAVAANGLAGLGKWLTWPLVGVGLSALIGLGCAWSAFVNWNKAAVIYENGFAYADHKGVKTLRWDEVDTITSQVTKHYSNGIYTGTTHLYTIVKMDQDRLQLDDKLAKVEDLATVIRSKAFPVLFQRYSLLYQAGVPLQFGQATISRVEGIRVGKKQFPWDGIASVQVKQGEVHISRKGGGLFSGAKILPSVTPNVEILLAIVDQMVGVKT